MNHLKIISKWVLPSVKIAYNLLAVSAEVFCRHSFGQRYAPQLLASFFFCFVTMECLRALAQQAQSLFVDVYLLTFFILILYHLGKMWRPARNIHSHGNGLSWRFTEGLGIKPTVMRILIEPAIHVFVGFLILQVSALLGSWLMAAGLCLFVKEFMIYWKHRNRILDSVDARIEGERIGTGVRQFTSPQSGSEQGVSPVVAVEQAPQPASSISQIFSRLDPALQQLVTTPGRNHPGTPAINRSAPQSNPRRYHGGPLGTYPRISSKRPTTQ